MYEGTRYPAPEVTYWSLFSCFTLCFSRTILELYLDTLYQCVGVEIRDYNCGVLFQYIICAHLRA